MSGIKEQNKVVAACFVLILVALLQIIDMHIPLYFGPGSSYHIRGKITRPIDAIREREIFLFFFLIDTIYSFVSQPFFFLKFR